MSNAKPPTAAFKGIDWSELSERWGLNLELEDHLLSELTIKHMLQGEPCELAQDIRAFLEALCKQSENWDYCSPVWNGLLEVEHDETLIKFTTQLLECMWT